VVPKNLVHKNFKTHQEIKRELETHQEIKKELNKELTKRSLAS